MTDNPRRYLMQTGVRGILGLFLLTEVWWHAHWAVAVCLSLLLLRDELQGWLLRRERQQLEAGRQQLLAQLDKALDNADAELCRLQGRAREDYDA